MILSQDTEHERIQRHLYSSGNAWSPLEVTVYLNLN